MIRKRTTVLIPTPLLKKLTHIKKELGYSSITHIIVEAIREFVEQKGY